jgi:hypothetical protein
VPSSAVALATNGSCELVSLHGTFPASEDIFRVAAIGAGNAWVEIGLVGGSYQTGQATVKLQQGKKLTLMNNADSTRYVIELRKNCAVTTAPVTTTTTTTTPAIPPPAAPATTATIPVVTDSLDTTTPSAG